MLGVDPGSLRTGWGAVASDGRRVRLVGMGTLVPPPRLALPERLLRIHAGVRELIERLRPDLLAVEDVFHAVNTRTALVLGHVRGVVLLAGSEAGLPVEAFPPATVKVQVTGFGRAEKRQVALMVTRLLDLPALAPPGDAADALAIALCGAQRASSALPAAAQAGAARRRRAW